MKNKLYALLFLFIILSACERKTEILVAQSVPDTETFSLFDVLDAVYGSHASGNLASAFADSDAAKFDPAYGSKTMLPQTLLGFRNYGAIGTYDDWYLPQLFYLDKMYNNLYKSGVGNFYDVYDKAYWSADEYDANNAWVFAFWVYSNWGVKSYLGYVRAMRSFLGVTGAYSLRNMGPAGGWIFHISDVGNGTSWFYECAPSDQSSAANYNDANTLCNNLVIYH